MRAFFRDLLASILAVLARAVLRKYKPLVVMVTGSVGKTSTKDATKAVLSEAFYLRSSKKNFNSEFGVPITIFGMADRWRKVSDWPAVIGEALLLLLLPNHYPKVLVLEVGADRPGDLARILKIATPDAVVVTRLPKLPVHVEAYATPAEVREEEFAPAYALAPDAPLVLCADDEYACALAVPIAARTTTYGEAKESDVRIGEEKPFIEDGRLVGMQAQLHIGGTAHTLVVRGTVGRPQLLAPAAAVTMGMALGMSVKAALKGAAEYAPPAGRGRLIAGMNGTTLIDDSYNASPAAVEEALSSLQIAHAALEGSRRIAVLGDMLELGRYSQQEHERIGQLAAKNCDVLVAVGTRSRAMAEAACAAGFPNERAHVFETSKEAADFLKTFVEKDDLILIKGSQSIRTERITEALLANPEDRQLLVRQDAQWKRA